jgi:tellurite methyltransferase
MMDLAQCENMDIYVIDQILKHRIKAGQRVIDVGCGSGRNVHPLVTLGCDVWGYDLNPQAIRQLLQYLPPGGQTDQFCCADFKQKAFANQSFDLVICNAVLHFAQNVETFHAWADAAWAHLHTGGLFFARLSTQTAWPEGVDYCFPFVASEADLVAAEQRWQAHRVEPLKTTRVGDLRTMTTWVLEKK